MDALKFSSDFLALNPHPSRVLVCRQQELMKGRDRSERKKSAGSGVQRPGERTAPQRSESAEKKTPKQKNTHFPHPDKGEMRIEPRFVFLCSPLFAELLQTLFSLFPSRLVFQEYSGAVCACGGSTGPKGAPNPRFFHVPALSFSRVVTPSLNQQEKQTNKKTQLQIKGKNFEP